MFRPHHTPQNLMHIIPSVLNIFLPQTDMFSEFSFYPVDIPSAAAAAAAKSLQSCPTLCNPVDGSPPGSPVPGILQARTLEWVAISFSNAWKWKPFNITVIQDYAPTSNAEEPEVQWFYEDLQDLLDLTPKKDVLFITEDWNAKVGSLEIPGVTGKYGLAVQNEAGQRLIAFC